MIFYANKEGSAADPYKIETANIYAAVRTAGKYFLMRDLMGEEGVSMCGERDYRLEIRPEGSDTAVLVTVTIPFEYTLSVDEPTIVNPQALAKFAGM